jgi:hypothetical protein
VLLENASAIDNPIEGLISPHWMDPVTEMMRRQISVGPARGLRASADSSNFYERAA